MYKFVNSFIIFVCLSQFSSCRTSFSKLQAHLNAGDKAYQQGNYGEAEKEYLSAVSEAEKNGSDNVMVIISLRFLAQIYTAQGKAQEAEAVYKKRINLAESSLDEDPSYQATVYDDLAVFYILRNRFSDAEFIYQQGISLIEEAYGVNDARVAEKLEYYATLLRAKNYNT
ncbi:MAG: tetratricopeptide repeat protein, partial [Pyrinomonadaceae bacterium]